MDIGRAVTYVFQDPQWIKKVAIGGILLIIPIIGPLIVAGYLLRIVRQVATADDLPLPEWNDFGGDLIRGLKGVVAGVVWALPLIVLWSCVSLPMGLVESNNGSIGIAAGGLAAAVYCLTFILQIALLFVLPLVYSRVAVTDSVGAALDFSAVIAEARANPVPLLIAVGLGYALGLLASLGVVLCVIGVLFTGFLVYTMMGHIYGQIRRNIDGGAATRAVESPVV